jgi:hypothetical protein
VSVIVGDEPPSCTHRFVGIGDFHRLDLIVQRLAGVQNGTASRTPRNDAAPWRGNASSEALDASFEAHGARQHRAFAEREPGLTPSG